MKKIYLFATLSSLSCLILGYALGGRITHTEAENFYSKEIQSRTIMNATLILGGLELMRKGENTKAVTMHEQILCGYLLSIKNNKEVVIEADDYTRNLPSRINNYIESAPSLKGEGSCWSGTEELGLILNTKDH